MDNEPQAGDDDPRAQQPPRAADGTQPQGGAVGRFVQRRKHGESALPPKEYADGEETDDVERNSNRVGQPPKPEDADDRDHKKNRGGDQGHGHVVLLTYGGAAPSVPVESTAAAGAVLQASLDASLQALAFRRVKSVKEPTPLRWVGSAASNVV
jgi:hypothetical protein